MFNDQHQDVTFFTNSPDVTGTINDNFSDFGVTPENSFDDGSPYQLFSIKIVVKINGHDVQFEYKDLPAELQAYINTHNLILV